MLPSAVQAGGGVNTSVLYYVTNNTDCAGNFVRATGTFDNTRVYTTELDESGNGYVEVDGMEYYNLEFYYIDENETEVTLLETNISATMGSVQYIKLIGNKVFVYGNDHLEPGYSLISKYNPSGTGEVQYYNGDLYIVRSGGAGDRLLVCGYIPFIKQTGMNVINFRWSYSYENTSYRNENIALGIANDDLLSTDYVVTAFSANNNMEVVSRKVSSTSISGLENGTQYFIKFHFVRNVNGYHGYLYIHDIWFE